jgi:hypothetical protein
MEYAQHISNVVFNVSTKHDILCASEMHLSDVVFIDCSLEVITPMLFRCGSEFLQHDPDLIVVSA